MIPFVVNCLVKTSVILGAAFVLSIVLRRRSAALRHLVWAAAIVCAASVPLLSVVSASWRPAPGIYTLTRFSPPLAAATIEAPAESTRPESPDTDEDGPSQAALWVWLSGSLATTGLFARGALKLRRISQVAEPFADSRWTRLAGELSRRFGLQRRGRLVQNSAAALLVTWGTLRPRVLLPAGAADWSDARIRAVLGHELAHIRRHDWIVQLIGEAARILFWFNPLIWLACGRLRHEGERACDDAVLNLGVDCTDYASELLALARVLKASHCAWMPSLAMARTSTLERRFVAMLNPSLDRRAIGIRTAITILALAFALTLPVAAMRGPIQTQTGRLFGRVYDPIGAPIKNATITVYNTANNGKDMTTSNGLGVFEFPRLAAGRYELQTVAVGFEPFQIGDVTIDASQEVNLNILTVASASAVPSTPPARAAATKPASGSLTAPPRLISTMPPVYPAGLKEQRVEGVVVLDGLIAVDGTPKSLTVVTSAIDPEFARAAVEAVKQWKYAPGTVEGRAAEMRTKMTVNFKLQPLQASAGVQAPPPPPAEVTGGEAPKRVRIGGNVQQSRLISQTRPVYPPEAKQARIQGVVILEVIIDKTGAVEQVNVVKGEPELTQAAVDAVSQWRYEPVLLNGEAVEVVTTVTVNFAIQQ